MQDASFLGLLYRYFFFGWLFKNVRRQTDVFERAAALRYNRDQARWLPVYLMRWLWWGLAFYVLGYAAELALEAIALSSLLYTVSAMSVPFIVAIGMTWVALRGAKPQSR